MEKKARSPFFGISSMACPKPPFRLNGIPRYQYLFVGATAESPSLNPYEQLRSFDPLLKTIIFVFCMLMDSSHLISQLFYFGCPTAIWLQCNRPITGAAGSY
jgi:hypothetical protein